jgi:hypothetical protein
VPGVVAKPEWPIGDCHNVEIVLGMITTSKGIVSELKLIGASLGFRV